MAKRGRDIALLRGVSKTNSEEAEREMRLIQACLVALMALGVAGCEFKGLRQLDKPGDGPDEFRIVPAKPLEAPTDYSALPAPTPGGANLTDQQPVADATAALGGRRSADTGSIPGGDGALVNHASRFGREAGIRQTLAAADEDFRRRRGRLTQIRIVPVDRYKQVYSRQALDADRELRRWRNAGARTPSAPVAQ